MSKISKSQKKFRWKQFIAYGSTTAVLGAVVTPISIAISKAQKVENPLVDQDVRYSLNKSSVFQPGVQIIKAFENQSDGSWKKNENFTKYFNRSKIFGFRMPEKKIVTRDNPDFFKQGHLYISNGIRIFSADGLALGQTINHDSENNDYMIQGLTGDSTIKLFGQNGFIKEIADELLSLPTSFVGARTTSFLLGGTLLDGNIAYNESNSYAISGESGNALYLLSIPLAACQVIGSFINDYWESTYDGTGTLTPNAEVASILAASEESILKKMGTNKKTILEFIKCLKDSEVFEKEIDINNEKIKFKDYMKKAIIQNIKWTIHNKIIKQAIFNGTPKDRTQYSTLKGEGSMLINKIISNYKSIGSNNQGSFKEGLPNGQKFAFKNENNDLDDIKKLITIPRNLDLGIAENIDLTNIYSLKNAAWTYSGNSLLWNKDQNKFVSNGGITKSEYSSSSYSGRTLLFGWRTKEDRVFIKNKFDGIKTSIENKPGFEKPNNHFSISTDDDSYDKFKEIIEALNNNNLKLESKKAFIDNFRPSEAISGNFNYNMNLWTFNDSNKTINGVTLNIPLRFYSETIKNFIKNPKLSKNQNFEEITKVLFKYNSSLRFNVGENKIFTKDDDKNPIAEKTFTFINKHNIEVILNKVYSEIFDGSTTTFKDFIKEATDNRDLASALRLFMQHVSQKSELDNDGFLTQYQFDKIKNDFLNVKIDDTGQPFNQGDIPISYLKNQFGYTSYNSEFSKIISDLVSISTFYVKPDDAIYATEYNRVISLLNAQGFPILNNDLSGFSDTLKNGVKALIKNFEKTDVNVSFVGPYQNEINESWDYVSLYIKSPEQIDHVLINNNKLKVYPIPNNLFISDSPVSKIDIDDLQGKYLYFTKPFNIGRNKHSVVLNSLFKNTTNIIEFFKDGSGKEKITLNKVSSRLYPKEGWKIGEMPLALAPGLLDVENNEIVIKTFINTKGL